MLSNLRDEIGVPIILIGTYSAAKLLQSKKYSLIRRLIDGGLHELRRPEDVSDKDFQKFCDVCWGYQWVRRSTPFASDEIKAVFVFRICVLKASPESEIGSRPTRGSRSNERRNEQQQGSTNGALQVSWVQGARQGNRIRRGCGLPLLRPVRVRFAYRPDRFPITQCVLQQNIESRDAFVKRKIQRLVAEAAIRCDPLIGNDLEAVVVEPATFLDLAVGTETSAVQPTSRRLRGMPRCS
jgi:hypothetical protein